MPDCTCPVARFSSVSSAYPQCPSSFATALARSLDRKRCSPTPSAWTRKRGASDSRELPQPWGRVAQDRLHALDTGRDRGVSIGRTSCIRAGIMIAEDGDDGGGTAMRKTGTAPVKHKRNIKRVEFF